MRYRLVDELARRYRTPWLPPLLTDFQVGLAMVVVALPAGFAVGYGLHVLWHGLADGLSRSPAGP